MIIDLGDKKLKTAGDDFYIAPNAVVIGDVQLSKDTSIWFNATLRGDNEPIVVGEGSNIQDGSVIHTDPGYKCLIGKNVTVGHMVMLHGCEIGDGSLIGIGSVVLNGAKIGKNCIIGAKALITEGMEIPDGSMVVGVPGKIKKTLSDDEQKMVSIGAHHYIENYKKYKKWCDEYFYLPHRNEARGIGGIFFDYKKDNFEKDFKFIRDVGVTFQMIFNNIIEKKIKKKWTLKDKEMQYIKRGRYAEFNLLYDRGTKFGLQTGGNVEGILMSLPPIAKWK